MSICCLGLLFLGTRFTLIADDYRKSYEAARTYCEYQNALPQGSRNQYFVLNFKNTMYLWMENTDRDKTFQSYYLRPLDKTMVPVKYEEWRPYLQDLKRNIKEFDQKIINNHK